VSKLGFQLGNIRKTIHQLFYGLNFTDYEMDREAALAQQHHGKG
jgi:hypothetical protein